MIRIAVCEDDEIQLKIILTFIEEFLNKTGRKAYVNNFSKGEELLQEALSDVYDIYFLDLLMPGLNGMEVAKKLRAVGDKGKIIFQTSSLDYAVESYEVDAYYYLLKPVDKDKLYGVLERAFCELKGKKENLLVKTKTGNEIVDVCKIMYVDVSNRTPVFHISGSKELIGHALRTSFKELVGDLPEREDFGMCSISTLVNLKFISKITSDRIVLADGTEIYPSRNYFPAISNKWKCFIK